MSFSKKYNVKFILILMSLLFLLVGCQKIPSSNFYDNQSSIAVMWASSSEHANQYNEYVSPYSMLIDAVLSSKAKKYQKTLETIKIAPIAEKDYLLPYGKKLEEKGMDVSLVRLPLDKSKLNLTQKRNLKQAKHDFRHLNEQNIDYVMFVDINRFGITQSRTWGLNILSPRKNLNFILYVIDTKNNNVIGKYMLVKSRKVSKKWKKNNYKILKRDINDLLTNGFKKAYNDFFGSKKYDEN
ncbi:MAG: hypothetical protein CMP39_05520 [Rickettsiales bacterium]|nr:hypothetical protein [Rickettsiales bacterium]|tara:strand:+ start:2004 stop:2723 length:720 start_codon:yes stop_codon:yes gene_type:complete